MSRESDFVIDITKQTDRGDLVWANVSVGKYSEYIFQRESAYQAFSTTFKKDSKTYELLLVHKKAPTYNTDLDSYEEQHSTELLVLCDARLISTITSYVVDDLVLGTLADSVDQENVDVDELFGDANE